MRTTGQPQRSRIIWKSVLPGLGLCTLLLFSVGCRTSDSANRPSPFTTDTLTINETTLAIAYSSPRVRGRIIWGELVPYNKIWRTGANEATVFSTDRSIRVSNTILPAGKYSVYTVPSESTWTVIFNTDWEQWGAYNYTADNDALRLTLTPDTDATKSEEMQFLLEEDALIFHWDQLRFTIPIEMD